MLASALKRFPEVLIAENKDVYFDIFQRFYFGTGKQLSYDRLAAEYRLSRFDVGNYLRAARGKFRETALELIGEYVWRKVEGERIHPGMPGHSCRILTRSARLRLTNHTQP